MNRSKRGGQPKKSDQRGGTRQVRLFDDVAWMVYWITEVSGEGTAEFLDPIVRPALAAEFARRKVEIDTLINARGWSDYRTPAAKTEPVAPKRKKKSE